MSSLGRGKLGSTLPKSPSSHCWEGSGVGMVGLWVGWSVAGDPLGLCHALANTQPTQVFPVSPCQDSPLGSLAKLKEPAALLEQPDPLKAWGAPRGYAPARSRGAEAAPASTAGTRLDGDSVLGVGSAVAPWRWDWNPC